MSDFENPYQSPETPVVPEKIPSSGTVLSENILRYLKEASPWMRFIGILGFIGSGLFVLTGIISVITIFAAFEFIAASTSTLAVLLVYLPVGALLFFPSLFTYRFGAKLRSYFINNMEEDLELAFKNNKSLWKFNGILYIIYLGAIPVFIVIMIIVGIASIM